MPSKKSESSSASNAPHDAHARRATSQPAAATAPDESPSAAVKSQISNLKSEIADPDDATSASRNWAAFFASNWWVPLILAALVPLGWLVENQHFVNGYMADIIMRTGINITLAVSLQLINGVSGQFSLGHAGFMAAGAYLAGYATLTYSAMPGDPDADPFKNPVAIAYFVLTLALFVAVVGAACWVIFLAIRASRGWRRWLPPILSTVLALWIVADLLTASRLGQSRPWLIWSGLLQAVPNGFMAALAHGMPTASSLSAKLPQWSLRPLCMILVLIGGGIFAAFAGLIVGLPTLRLRGDYLAIATLGFGQIIAVCIGNCDALGAARGMAGIPRYANPADLDENLAAHYIFPWIFGVAVITILAIWRLVHSAKGRAIRAVRDDEIAAAAVGVDTTHHKVIAFVIGAFFAGVAGAFWASFEGYIIASEFDFMRSVDLVVMVTLGGLGSIWGAVIAAILLTFAPDVLRMLNLGEYRMTIYAALLIAVMIARARFPYQRWSRWRKRLTGPAPAL